MTEKKSETVQRFFFSCHLCSRPLRVTRGSSAPDPLRAARGKNNQHKPPQIVSERAASGVPKSTAIARELSTAVRVDQPGVREAHFQVVQQRGLMQVTEGGQVVQALQDVWVPQRWQGGGLAAYLVLHHLRRQKGKTYFLKIGHKDDTLEYAKLFFLSLL